jgi:iron complex outermembrane recepter protein
LQVRRRVLLCLCIVAIAWITRLAGAPSSEPVRYNFKIESQPLGTALQEFAKQSGVQIIFFSQVTEGFQAPALNGSYTISGALQTLLSGSHLTFRVINPKTIEICPSAAIELSIFTIRPLEALRAAIDTEPAQLSGRDRAVCTEGSRAS